MNMDNEAESCFQQGCELARNNKFVEAIPLFEQAAALGHEDAVASLATIYINGNGVEIDYTKGLKYLEKSVNSGDVYSINLLGTLYLEGKGVEQNYEQALISFEIAAENGYPYAMLNASGMYLEGKGTGVNVKKSVQYLLDAIDVWGDIEEDNFSVYPSEWQMNAHEQMEHFLEDKTHIPVLEEIATEGDRVAQYYMYQSRMTTFLDNISDFTNENHEKILSWLIKSADSGFPNAQYELGICYHGGVHCNKDVQKGIFYLQQAAEQGHSGAIFWLESNRKSL